MSTDIDRPVTDAELAGWHRDADADQRMIITREQLSRLERRMRRAEDALQDERLARGDVYRQLTATRDDRDRAVRAGERAIEQRDQAAASASRARIERDAAVDERRDLEQRIAAAAAHLDAHDQPDGVGSLIDQTITILRGET